MAAATRTGSGSPAPLTPNEDAVYDTVKPIMAEYLLNGDRTEIAELFERLKADGVVRSADFVAALLRMGLEHNDPERELVSSLFPFLAARHDLSAGDLETGVEILLDDLSDLRLDVPDASIALGKFVARLVGDDCLPPKYVHSHPALAHDDENSDIRACLREAHLLLTAPHGLPRIDAIWGISGQVRAPLDEVMAKMSLALEEYLAASDVEEVGRCLHDLAVPHFLHEFVYEAVLLYLRHGAVSREGGLIATLLRSLEAQGFLTANQITLGFRRLLDTIDDLVLDFPRAKGEIRELLLGNGQPLVHLFKAEDLAVL